MRLRGVTSGLRLIARNSVFVGVAAVASILSYFGGFRRGVASVLGRANVQSDWAVDVVTLCVFTALLSVLLWAVQRIIATRQRTRVQILDTSMQMVLWSDAAGERIREYQDLRSSAKRSMLVMGIGMTFLSTDLKYVEHLLDQDRQVRLLMMDPDVVTDPFRLVKPGQCTVERGLFDSYFRRKGYARDLRTSYDRLVSFIVERSRSSDRKGAISLRKYPYLVPMNVTMVDEHEARHGHMLVEWCLPFGDWRMSARMSQSEHAGQFRLFRDSIEELWRRSERVVHDRRQG